MKSKFKKFSKKIFKINKNRNLNIKLSSYLSKKNNNIKKFIINKFLFESNNQIFKTKSPRIYTFFGPKKKNIKIILPFLFIGRKYFQPRKIFKNLYIRKKKNLINFRFFKQRRLLRLFYGNLKPNELWYQNLRMRKEKMITNSIMLSYWEFRMDCFLKQLGITRNLYESQRLIPKGIFTLNNKIIRRFDAKLKPFDVFSVSTGFLKNFYKKFFMAKLYLRKFHQIQHIHIPSFIEINFLTFEFMLFKTPRYKNLTTPFYKKKLIWFLGSGIRNI